jgi:hypothetical protein
MHKLFCVLAVLILLWAPRSATALSLGNQANNSISGTFVATVAATLSSTVANAGVLVVILEVNSSIDITSSSVTIGSTSLGAWGAARGFINVSGVFDQGIYEFVQPFTSALTSEQVTATLGGGGGYGFATLNVFEISGAKTSSYFDPNLAGGPVTGNSDPISITTTGSNDFIVGGFRTGASTPTQGSGWTIIQGANFQLTEYQVVSSPQTSLSVSVGTGSGTANGVIADAIVGGAMCSRSLRGVGC